MIVDGRDCMEMAYREQWKAEIAAHLGQVHSWRVMKSTSTRRSRRRQRRSGPTCATGAESSVVSARSAPRPVEGFVLVAMSPAAELMR